MKQTSIFKMALAAALFIPTLSWAAPSGTEIMTQVKEQKAPAFTHSLVEMVLTEKSGTASKRLVEEWGRKKDNLKAVVIIFRSPADVQDTRFLVQENAGRADDKWIYLPALRTTRRIAASEGKKAFMGTDASYDDLGERAIADDTHTLLGEEVKDGHNCWKVESVPVKASSSAYSKRISWIDKSNNTAIYAEMYDKKGQLLKTIAVPEIKNMQGYHIPMATVVKNVQTGHSTSLKMLQIELDKAIADEVFSQNFLNNGRI